MRYPALVVIVSLVAGVAGVIAVSDLVDRRSASRFRATTVQLPARLNAVPRNLSGRARELGANFAVGGFRTTDAAVYGRVGEDAVILLATKPASALDVSEQNARRAAFERAFSIPGSPLHLAAAADPGPLGGWIGCGPDYRGLEICFAVNRASVVAVISATGPGNPVSLLREARAAAVHSQS